MHLFVLLLGARSLLGVIKEHALPHKFFHLNALELPRNGQVLLGEVSSQADEVRAHGTVFTVLQRVFVVLEHLRVCLADVLAEHRNDLVARLVVERE